LGIELN